MQVKYMTLDGKVDREAFMGEWWNSDKRDATFLQTQDCVYLMPYGHFSGFLSDKEEKVKFAGTDRPHTFVKRDFDITDAILGGGYLALNADRTSCQYSGSSRSFHAVPDVEAVIVAVAAELLK